MVENAKEGPDSFKYEYEHYMLAPGIHFGKHRQWGTHIALGEGANSIHIYPSKIYIGGKEGSDIVLSPSQMLIVKRILNRLEQKISSDKLLEKIKSEETKDGTRHLPSEGG
jgi:hypothetical protein